MRFILYKFFEKEVYREEFLTGTIYANKLSYYRKQENGTAGVSDSFENAKLISWPDDKHFVQNHLLEKDGELYVESIAYDEKPDGYIENQGLITFGRDKNVFCMSSILLDDNGIVQRFDKRNAEDFGNYGVLIARTQEFICRIKQSDLKAQGIKSIVGGFVEYIDFEKRDAVQSWGPFFKFSNYAYQQEYRLVFDSNVEKELRYSIGSIKDISMPIDDKETFFGTISEGKPLFQNQ